MRIEILNLRKELPLFFPHELKEMRKSVFLSQGEAAFLCRVSVETIRAWENRKNVMPDLAWAYWLIQWKRVAKILKENYPRERLVMLLEKEKKFRRQRLQAKGAFF